MKILVEVEVPDGTPVQGVTINGKTAQPATITSGGAPEPLPQGVLTSQVLSEAELPAALEAMRKYNANPSDRVVDMIYSDAESTRRYQMSFRGAGRGADWQVYEAGTVPERPAGGGVPNQNVWTPDQADVDARLADPNRGGTPSTPPADGGFST